MGNLRFALVLLFVFAALASSTAKGQNIPISQVQDVKSTDKFYPALKNLIENYDASVIYPDKTFRANLPLKRGEFAVMLHGALDKMLQFARKSDPNIVGSGITKRVYGSSGDTRYDVADIKDISPNDKKYAAVRNLINNWFIDLRLKDYYVRPDEPISEKDFYNCLLTIFKGDPTAVVEKNYSENKSISRGAAVIEMSKFLDEIRDERVPSMTGSKTDNNASVQKNISSALSKNSQKLDIIKNLPSRGRARITGRLDFYLDDSPCADLSGAGSDIKTAFAEGGIWGEYRINKGDEGDIVYETNNTCAKGRIVLLRVGTAIVTMREKGIKRIK